VSGRTSVCVVGAGVLGLATAYELTRLGAGKVTVLEEEFVASGASGRSVGVIESQYMDAFDVELRVRSLATFEELERDHGLSIVRAGYLRLARTEADLARFERSVEIQRELGVVDAVTLPAQDIARRFPDVRVDDLAGGLFGPSDGFLDGHLLCMLLAELIEAAGAEVVTRARVRDHSQSADGTHRLDTTAGPFACDVVVNAAGACAGEVGELLGVVTPTLPQRHEVVTVHLPAPLPYVLPSVVDFVSGGEEGCYLRYDTPTQLIGGVHGEQVDQQDVDPRDWFEGVQPDYYERMSHALARRMPRLIDASLGRGWAGLYPSSPDGQPLVGPCREDASVVAACGAGAYGIQIAPVVGRLAAEWIVYGEARSLSDPARLLPGRAGADPTA
jgi:sarcosine oxidase subunit beta